MTRDGAGTVEQATRAGSQREQAAMSAEAKVKNTGQDAKGNAEEELGKATGDKDTEADGTEDQAAAGVKKTGEQAKETASDALKDLKAKVEENT